MVRVISVRWRVVPRRSIYGLDAILDTPLARIGTDHRFLLIGAGAREFMLRRCQLAIRDVDLCPGGVRHAETPAVIGLQLLKLSAYLVRIRRW